MARRTGIIGGGALGLTLAYRLAGAGDQVTVIEREPEPGGLAAGFRVGPSWLEKAYHHLFRSDRAATRLIEEVGLGDRLVWPRPVTATLLHGEIRQLDEEIKRDAWLAHPASIDLIFHAKPDELWQMILRHKGWQYRLLSQTPEDLSWN